RHGVGADRVIESFEREFPEGLKTELLTNAQLRDHVRDQDLSRLGTRTESGRHLGGRSKNVAMTFHRFTGGDADSNMSSAARPASRHRKNSARRRPAGN